MRILEVRRHSIANEPGKHLSQEGIALAQSVGPIAGPFSRVVTSPVSRAVETAVAMGFPVDETWPVLADLTSDTFKKSGFPAPFDQLARSISQHHDVETFADTQAQAWRDIVSKVDDGDQALIIGHGCFIELGAIACLPHGSFSEWNGPIGNCEGFRFKFEDRGFVSAEVLRIPANQ